MKRTTPLPKKALQDKVALNALAFFLTTNEEDKKMASVSVGKRRNDSFKGSETARDEGGGIGGGFKGLASGLSSPLRNTGKSFKGMFKRSTPTTPSPGKQRNGAPATAAAESGARSDDDAYEQEYVRATRDSNGAGRAGGADTAGDGAHVGAGAVVELAFAKGDVFKVDAIVDDAWFQVEAVKDGTQGRVLQAATEPCAGADGAHAAVATSTHGGVDARHGVAAASNATPQHPASSTDVTASPFPATTTSPSSPTSTSTSTSASSTPQPPEKTRMTPVDELINTERSYLADLMAVKDDFYPKLRSVSTAQEASKLFGNWATLIPLAEELLAALHARQDDGAVAAIMLEKLPQFSTPYGKYCNRIPAAQELYTKKLEEQAFRDFEASFPELNKPTLCHLMRPAQRVMRYPMLLMEMAKAYDEGSLERAALEAAKDLAMQLAGEVNGTMGSQAVELTALNISLPDIGTAKQVVGVRRNTLNVSDGLIGRPPKPTRVPEAPPPRPKPPSSTARAAAAAAATPAQPSSAAIAGGAAATEAEQPNLQQEENVEEPHYQEVPSGSDLDDEGAVTDAGSSGHSQAGSVKIVQIYGDVDANDDSSGDTDYDFEEEEEVSPENGWNLNVVREDDYCDSDDNDEAEGLVGNQNSGGDVDIINDMYLGVGSDYGDDPVSGGVAVPSDYLMTAVAAAGEAATATATTTDSIGDDVEIINDTYMGVEAHEASSSDYLEVNHDGYQDGMKAERESSGPSKDPAAAAAAKVVKEKRAALERAKAEMEEAEAAEAEAAASKVVRLGMGDGTGATSEMQAQLPPPEKPKRAPKPLPAPRIAQSLPPKPAKPTMAPKPTFKLKPPT